VKYAVFGTATVGRTIAGRLDELGHEVIMGTRDPEETVSRATQDAYGNPPWSAWSAEHPRVALPMFAEAAGAAEVLVNATSGTASVSVFSALPASSVDGKTIVDIANPLDFSGGMPPALDPVGTDSLGEQLQRAMPSARVVKTLNTMGAHIMVAPATLTGDHTVFVSGDDPAAKVEVAALLEEFGWPSGSIVDVGDITTARGTEMLLPLWLRLWGAFGNADFNFHIQR
jgi:8-hydroxy-5-deazaflavin:NADPH oxidoreductase